MYAQRKTSAAPRRNGYNRPVPTRLRMGLVMRRNMNFGDLGDVEGALRVQGVGLAPISTGDASLVEGGITVLATATANDISEGRLKGLVVPGGSNDEASVAAVRALIVLARDNRVPVLALSDGVALSAEVFGMASDAPGAVFADGQVKPLFEREALGAVVETF